MRKKKQQRSNGNEPSASWKKLHFRDSCVVKQNRKCAINFRYKEFVGYKILCYCGPSMSKHIQDQ